ncbi:hypothetical protein lerEdw1_004739 [Lerista edwardsae]|nr:hypothetical protein lerEdw1_004739 [Lerista edwardsae]
MATQLFEGKDHAAFYKKYRFSPQEIVQGVIFSYLEKKGAKSFQLAADVGCGTGQGTHFLAKRFEKVVATDISQAQIEEATRAPHPPNISYLVCPAEKLPFPDSSVDFVMSLTAVHWFDLPPFMQEVDRILKPLGCLAFSSCTMDVQIHYKDCTEKLTEIYEEIKKPLIPYRDDKVKRIADDYKFVFDSLPFQDKERITDIVEKVPMTIAEVMGYIQSFSMYQTFLKAHPEEAKSLIQNSERRFLEAMGVSSRDTPVELWMRYVCVLACKNA